MTFDIKNVAIIVVATVSISFAAFTWVTAGDNEKDIVIERLSSAIHSLDVTVAKLGTIIEYHLQDHNGK